MRLLYHVLYVVLDIKQKCVHDDWKQRRQQQIAGVTEHVGIWRGKLYLNFIRTVGAVGLQFAGHVWFEFF